MGFDFTYIQKGVQKKARKIIIYGPPKIGKSSLAGATKDALMIPTEDRVAHIACDKTPVVSHYDMIVEVIDYLLNNKTKYKRLIIDTLDWLEPLIHQAVVDDLNGSGGKSVRTINDDHCKETAFQKGLKYLAPAKWKELFRKLDDLRDKGIDVILVAHSQVIKVNLPDADEYEKFVMKIDKNALSVVEEWADVIAFYSREIFVTKQGEGIKKTGKVFSKNNRKLFLEGKSAAMICGNSFGLSDPDDGVNVEELPEIMEWLLTGPYKEEIGNAKKAKTTQGE